ncbi:hypothetical protein B0I72DRAFT_133898 [Yarrowia lipolytica]|uniref:Uncharacterized protein n=1 Tax=Yarrowia lipolytica TaxID=4952 RepID=A0A371C226_YARLL|nr:hypothetical protein BKA91DRAFT_141318 [Yarrowia lipolytica]KAE8170049.1 hypothetical protein BKA90DRAFT_141556 [Yarrowia lipolytica]RDW24369.1 hypothetical protein B0I71DRAFT_134406 [Yarrowia lipolytica]RDW34835.1 hypothetical protein B0I72DRAFT_133898 [Yarrowia lipolytica]RDW40866.1 hypothetical protein B0I73DRAFT_129688 [Yarrowia lipolytica]
MTEASISQASRFARFYSFFFHAFLALLACSLLLLRQAQALRLCLGSYPAGGIALLSHRVCSRLYPTPLSLRCVHTCSPFSAHAVDPGTCRIKKNNAIRAHCPWRFC